MAHMDAEIFLIDYAKKADKCLENFFAEKQKTVSDISPIGRQMLEIYRDHLRGGKKARGALMVLGYLLAGGKDNQKILKASLFPEIIQSFLLIHDDIMDRDLLRRGKPTPQALYSALYRERKFKGDAEHFGLSMAIDLGDYGMYLGQEALFESGFEQEKITKVIKLANRIYQEVALGQALDIFGEVSGEFDEDYVLKVHFLKTAQYSVTAPLQFGAILAGAEEGYLSFLAKYGDPIGVAFQIHDDILGLFGEEKIIGKETGARDIREGKATLLIVKALERAKDKDKRYLESVYGRKKITNNETDNIRRIVKKSGSFDYSLKKERELVEEGKKNVLKITSVAEKQDTLYSLADFMIKRKK